MTGIYEGIYEGNRSVIHLTRTHAKRSLPVLLPSYLSSEHENPPCKKCCHPESGSAPSRGVVRVCIDCFCRDGSAVRPLRAYAYGMPWWRLCFSIPGTCTAVSATRSPEEVAQIARAFLQEENFGDYDLLRNNCEHFGTFCVTGEQRSEQADRWVHLTATLYRLPR